MLCIRQPVKNDRLDKIRALHDKTCHRKQDFVSTAIRSRCIAEPLTYRGRVLKSDTPVHRHLVIFSFCVLRRYLQMIGINEVRGMAWDSTPFRISCNRFWKVSIPTTVTRWSLSYGHNGSGTRGNIRLTTNAFEKPTQSATQFLPSRCLKL
jgi:hypothetical protein